MGYNLESVKSYVKENSNSILCEDRYLDCKTKMKFKCECGEFFFVSFDAFKNKKKTQCNSCSISNMQKSIEDVKLFVKDNMRGYRFVNFEYRKVSKRNRLYIQISCSNDTHPPFWNAWQSIKSGQRCSECYYEKRKNNPSKWNKENILRLLAENKLKIVDHDYKFNNAREKIKCLNEDNYYVDVLINSLVSGNKPSAFANNKYAIDNLKLLCKRNNITLISNEWKGIKQKYEGIDRDGYMLYFYTETLINNSTPRKFHPSNKFSIYNIQHYCNLNGLEYEICSTNYIREDKPLLFKYIGNEIKLDEKERFFTVPLSRFLYDNQRHPYFYQSKKEVLIEKWLVNNDVRFESQYKFKDCTYKRSLQFDFAVFNQNDEIAFLLEYDGIQHYEPVEHFGGEEGFKIRKLRDEIKDEYCKTNNIKLIRIPYWDKDNIESILTNLIK